MEPEPTIQQTRTRKVTMAATQGDDLLARTYHIDGRVTAIEGRMDTFGAQLNRIEGALLNRQSPWNISAIIALVMMVGALLMGISGYVDLQLGNLKQTVDRNTEVADRHQDTLDRLESFRSEMHFEIGKMHKDAENFRSIYDKHDTYHSGLDERLRKVEEKAAAAEVSRRAIGDFAKDMDAYGSRRWIGTDKGEK